MAQILVYKKYECNQYSTLRILSKFSQSRIPKTDSGLTLFQTVEYCVGHKMLLLFAELMIFIFHLIAEH